MLSVAGLAYRFGGCIGRRVCRCKSIVRGAGVSKNTVKAAWASDGPLKCERAQRGSIVNEMEPPIRELLKAYPQMPPTVIAERIGNTDSQFRNRLVDSGRALDVRVNGGIHIRLREALGPIRGASLDSEPEADR